MGVGKAEIESKNFKENHGSFYEAMRMMNNSHGIAFSDTQEGIIDTFQNNFIVYSANPVKTWVKVLNIIKELEAKFPSLSYVNKGVVLDYCNIVKMLMDSTDDVSKVYLMVSDKLFSKLEVIDVLAYKNLQVILNSSMIDRIVTDFWEGPYETRFFMHHSTAYLELESLYTEEQTFMNYKKKKKYKYSILKLFSKQEREQDRTPTKTYAHFFHYKLWK